MQRQTYRLTTATLGILKRHGQETLIVIPIGGMIEVELEGIHADRLADVHWQDETVMIFPIDLQTRGQLVTAAGV